MNPLTWIRNACRNAVLGGVADAVEELAATGQAALTLTVELPALAAPPAPTEPTPETRRRRAGA